MTTSEAIDAYFVHGLLDDMGVPSTACGGEGDAEVRINIYERLRLAQRILAEQAAERRRRSLPIDVHWLRSIFPADDEFPDVWLGSGVKLRRADIYRSVIEQLSAGVPTNALELIELVLMWKNSPDVIVHAYDAILGLTKERMEAQR